MYVCMHASIQLPIDLFIYLSDGPIYPSIYLSIDYLPTHPISEKNNSTWVVIYLIHIRIYQYALV